MEGQENVNTGMKIENIENTKENPKMKLEDKIGLLQQQIRYYIGIIRRQNRIVRAYEMDKRRTNSEEARKRIIENQLEPEKKTLRKYEESLRTMEEELLMCEYWALEEYLKGSNGTYIAPADKLPKIYFLPVIGRLARFGNTQGYLAGRKKEIVEQLEKIRNEKGGKRSERNTEGTEKSKESADNGINNPVISKLDEFAQNNLVDNTTTRPNIKYVARLAKKPRTPGTPGTPGTLKNKPKTTSGRFERGKIGSSGSKNENTLEEER
jgi:hypothetical protein